MAADSAGRALPIFGQSLFEQPPSTFAPLDHALVTGDYVIGPDDELLIRIWGQMQADLRAVVDRAGQIYIPQVGPVTVAGVHYRDLDHHLKIAIQKLYRNFEITVGVGRLRSIQVYVVGQARYPGTYTISSLSTLVNAVFASGGPNPQGSLRDVQVLREGHTVAHLDLYDLLVRGDKSHDLRLQSGDVIFYPPVGPLVAVTGSVNAPAIYEMKAGSRLGELIDTAGGLNTVADAEKVVVERIGEHRERVVREFPLDAQSRESVLSDGDVVRVFSIVPRFGNAVTLRGNVANPGRYPWKQGMRVRDLIPDAQALLPRSYWISKSTMTDGRATEYPLRGGRPGDSADKVWAGQTDSEQARKDEEEKASVMLDTTGSESGHSGSAARPQRDFTGREQPTRHTLTSDLHRASPEINWSYAIIQRVNPVDLSTRLLAFDLGKAVLEGDAANNLALESGDIVTIFSQTDITVPQIMRARYVSVEGEVMRPGVYKVELGETLSHVVQRAGGATPQAFLYGTQLMRESSRKQQQESLDELARSLEVEIRQASVEASTRANPDDAQTLVARQAAQEALIAQLRSVRVTGRVVLNLKPEENSIDAYPKIEMEDNDRVVIPIRPSTVGVAGMVYNPGSFVFDARGRVGDYLKLAGRGRSNADMHRAFVMHADGTVIARASVNGSFTGDRFEDLLLVPGDQIVVPSKIQSGNFVRGLRDWTQITAQLALTGAALAVIH